MRLWALIGVAIVVVAFIGLVGSVVSPQGGDNSTKQAKPTRLEKVAAATRVDRTWRSGAYAGHTRTQDQAFATWRGAPLQSVTLFNPAVTWRQVEYPRHLIAAWGSVDSIELVLSTALWPQLGGSLAAAAAGKYDDHFVRLARHYVSGGLGTATIRLGWEFNGTWFRWSVANRHQAHEYAAAWRHIVTAMRSVHGQHFRFLWCVNIPDAAGVDPAAAYPGDRYVTYVGTDLYDLNPQSGDKVERLTPVHRWKSFVNGPYGLRWLAHFAGEHHKRLAFPEWGLVHDSRQPAVSGGDDPTFVLNMYRWFAQHDTALENYFNTVIPSGRDFRIADPDTPFPTAAKVYRLLYGEH